AVKDRKARRFRKRRAFRSFTAWHLHEKSNMQSRQSAVPCRLRETGMFLYGTAQIFVAQK
ncbi:hypothetical protein, partial [Mesorhizobium sp. M7A.F.Ca.US.005.03.2.1]|uniref:hypothetical protein n=1 Tax=Mesorhizobium sp. M7A.F.Ca.US.005.03.2.1 TaxID=2496737 RepID=UPI0019D1CB40